MKSILIILSVLTILSFTQITKGQDVPDEYLGHWGMDTYDMPYFSYTGKLPYQVEMKNGKNARIADDPYFLLGNYRFKLFAHVSGEYEIYTTERVISTFNKKENAKAIIEVDSKQINLTGVHSVAANPEITTRVFGAGFAEYSYALDKVECKRILSVLPSTEINQGISGFRISVYLKNTSKKKVTIKYTEELLTHYEKVSNTEEHKTLNYKSAFEKGNDNVVYCTTEIVGEEESFPLIGPNDFSYQEYFPPLLFVSAVFDGDEKLIVEDNVCKGNYTVKMEPGEEIQIDFIIGYSLTGSKEEIQSIRDTLMQIENTQTPKGAIPNNGFAKQWSEQVDQFDNEKDEDLRRELIWHSYVLESMASYSHYFKETFIPQGCMYFYSWGLRAAPRDQNQHALAACYTNPELAKSIIRYVLKKSDRKGNIPFQDLGNGVVTSKYYQTSDQQLFFFMLISEYFRITQDYDFLHEEVAYYPGEDAGKSTVLVRIGEYFRYLKEEVGLGPHGLIRLGNSDWNDLVFYRLKSQYNTHYLSNESLMNTTMAASILPKLNTELIKASEQSTFQMDSIYLKSLTQSIQIYRDKLWQAFLDDNGKRKFAKRMYFAGEAVGEDNMFLEPQGFLMQVEEYGLSKKETLYTEIQNRIMDEEVIGARQEEKEELSEYNFGSRENGGIWYSLNGPLVIGLSTWNKEAAWELFHKMTLNNQMKKYPQYWSCYWSSFDSVDSSILPSEALHTQESWIADGTKMTYCAHIHAWLLYSYKYLLELE